MNITGEFTFPEGGIFSSTVSFFLSPGKSRWSTVGLVSPVKYCFQDPPISWYMGSQWVILVEHLLFWLLLWAILSDSGSIEPLVFWKYAFNKVLVKQIKGEGNPHTKHGSKALFKVASNSTGAMRHSPWLLFQSRSLCPLHCYAWAPYSTWTSLFQISTWLIPSLHSTLCLWLIL